jgi:hypothetical protein
MQTRDRQPLPGAKVRVRTRQSTSRQLSSAKQMTADNAGAARVSYPSNDLERLEVAASHDDYGGRKMSWDIKAGDVIPPSFILRLGN